LLDVVDFQWTAPNPRAAGTAKANCDLRKQTETEVTTMALIRWSPRREAWDPFGALTEIQDEMNRMFDTSLHRRTGWDGLFTPAVDLVEEKDHFVLKADLPGLAKDDVSVTMQDNYLTIKGEKKHETETKEASRYLSERVYGAFSRTIELPTSVDAKKIDASFKDGVLRVTLPKTEEAKPKQIEVKVN
jgi:HSP20 family protein